MILPLAMVSNEPRAELAPGDWRSKPSELVPPPPREPSPRTVQLVHAYAGSQRIKLILGVVFLLLGSLFALIFCRGIGADAALLVAGKEHTGVVTDTRVRTDVEINGEQGFEVTFSYEWDGQRYAATSTGTSPSFREAGIGKKVDIELLPSKPELARIVGATFSTFGLGASFILLFPIIGFVLTAKVVLENQREIRAHRNGVALTATVVFRGPDTSTSSNDKHPFMVRWEFEVAGKRYRGEISHMEEAMLRDLGLNGEIVVLYDPANPKVNTAYIA